MDARARAVATLLSTRAHPGDRALLLYPPGLDFLPAFFGCLYAGVLAVPLPHREAGGRLAAVSRDAGPTLALTCRSALHEISVDGTPLFATDDLGGSHAAVHLPRPESVAYLQYTSGSTSSPRGVKVTHANVLHNVRMLDAAFAPPPREFMASWLPWFHDMGLLVFGFLPVYVGAPCAVMSPESFVKAPLRWLKAISDYRARTSGAPNFAYDLCVLKTTPAERASLDLSCWRLAFNGAEPVRCQTLDRFIEAFEPCGFPPAALKPSYGMAEATLFISSNGLARPTAIAAVDREALGRFLVRPGSHRLAGCGRTWLEQRIRIVHPQTRHPCAPDEVGEIWLSGPNVASGYWNGHDADTFAARLAGTDEWPFLRTGDLGFMDEDGEVYLAGRLKDLIIIHGINHYPQDIELTVEQAHGALRTGCGAAFSVERDGEERLIVVYEAATAGTPLEDVVAPVRRAVSEAHQLALDTLVLVEKGSVPKTTSGKIQRHACRDNFLAGRLRELARWTRETRNATPSREIREWLAQWLRERRGVTAAVGSTFADLGLDSVETVELAAALSARLGLPLSATAPWNHPTLDDLSRHAAAGEAAAPAGRAAAASPSDSPQGIAVVGLGCRLPGGVDGPERFWQLLVDGVDAVGGVPDSRWSSEAWHSAARQASAPRVAHGGFLDEIDAFDAAFFNITAAEAVSLDPQHRLLLEVSWEALENCGLSPAGLRGTATGVFFGICSNDYLRVLRDHRHIDGWTASGNLYAMASGRVSYVLGLEGPSMTLDTACSSSLLAVHLACQSIRAGECEVALAGGVNLMLAPEMTIAFAEAGALSPEGRCKTFDASADGYVRSEGCGVVVLKSLSAALRDRNPILALVRGSATNQDGRSNGLTAPRGLSQEAVLRSALAQAGLSPQQVGYVEAHGSGTPLGDAVELQALGAVLGQGRPPGRPLLIGCVKTNVGHTEAAAGVVGLMKTVLALRHERIPAHLHFRTPTPHFPWNELPLRVTKAATPWPSGASPRVAGVSAFGFSGTNVHVLVEEYPVPQGVADPDSRLQLLPLSARDPVALRRQAARYADHVAAHPQLPLASLCYTSGVGRTHFEHRLAVLAPSREQAAHSLRTFAEGSLPGTGVSVGEASTPPAIAFLFTGQGSQYPGMGESLYRTQPVFRAAMDACARLMDPLLSLPLLSVVYPEGDASSLHETRFAQPALFALEYALAELWRSWGIVPERVLGHSAGEYVAACVAGVLRLEDAARLVVVRARLMHEAAGGTTVSLWASEARARSLIDGLPATIAAINSPLNVAVSGEEDALAALCARAEAAGVPVTRLPMAHAAHSPHMGPVLAEFERTAAEIRFFRPRIPLVSGLTGHRAGDEVATADYWVRQLREPVRFVDAVRTLAAERPTVFVEAGPQPTLLSLAAVSVRDESHTWLPSLRPGRDDRATLLESLAALYARGAEVDWEGVHAPSRPRQVALPTYPFQRRRFWVEAPRKLPATWEITWEPRPIPAAASQADTRWLILADSGTVAAGLARDLEAHGAACVVAETADDGLEILQAALAGPQAPPLAGVVYLGGLDVPTDLDLVAVDAARATQLEPALRLVQAILAGAASCPRLWVVTRGATGAIADEPVNPAAAPLWGLGKGLAVEHPGLWGGLVDLPPVPDPGEVRSLSSLLRVTDGEDLVALRGGQRLVARLAPSRPQESAGAVVRGDRTYLITGGLGCLGLRVAERLIARGARHLVLTGRRAEPSAEAQSALDAWQARGVAVKSRAVDVTDREEMRALLDGIDASAAPLAGILHAAGVSTRDPLATMTTDRLRAVLLPKVTGASVLDELTAARSLDFFVCFSSITALWGARELSHYGAANQFLDALARRRRGEGKAGVSINWGPWSGGGMSADELPILERMGILPLGVEAALDALEHVLIGAPAQVAVVDLEPSMLRAVLESRGRRPFLELLPAAQAWVVAPPHRRQDLERLGGEARREALAALLASEITSLLGQDESSPIDPHAGFFKLGMDSLALVQLSNRLNHLLGIDLPVATLLQESSPERLLDHILQHWPVP